MSLDVYLYESRACPSCGTHVGLGTELYWANITHNLTGMADAAGIYLALWRPAEMLAPDVAAVMRDAEQQYGYHSEQAAEVRKQLPVVRARDLIETLRAGIAKLHADPVYFKRFDSPESWGRYEHFMPFVRDYLRACEEHPDAEVKVSR